MVKIIEAKKCKLKWKILQINPLLNDKILDVVKLKASADHKGC